MKSIRRTSQFKRDIKLAIKRGNKFENLKVTIEALEQGVKIPRKYRDHELHGKYKNCHECHIEPDWLLFYKRSETKISLIRTGSHVDLFQ